MRLLATYELPFPPSVNHYWFIRNGGHGKYLGPKGRKFRNDALAAIWHHHNGKPPTTSADVGLHITLIPPDRRVRDLDNYHKGIGDALKAAGVVADDKQIKVCNATMRPPEGKPGKVIVQVFEN